MATKKRLLKNFFWLIFPVFILLIFALIGASIWLIHNSATAPNSEYLITPEKYGLLSTRGAKITDENWSNKDGSKSRGWLLRGNEGSPAVILLHRYGADRSWVLNLGVKLNETTNATVLMPDLRGHGVAPLVKQTNFGGSESDDILAAIEFLQTLKSESGKNLVANGFGVYGVELGALSAISSAAKEPGIKALALDSVPINSNDLITSVIEKKYPFASSYTSKLAQFGTNIYFFRGGFNRESMCDEAKKVSTAKVLVLAGNDSSALQESSGKVSQCFPNPSKIQTKLDLMPSGYNIINASIEQSEIYEQRVIDFFSKSLLTTSE